MTKYSDKFLGALGEWQQGWNEDKEKRLLITEKLKNALAVEPSISPSALAVSVPCYRRRYISNLNPQNGGDMVELFLNGYIEEGVSSWSTDYDYVKTQFKKGHREGWIASIFCVQKIDPSDVVLNINELWKDNDFKQDVNVYVSNEKPYANALTNFSNKQSEVILRVPLKIEEVYAFCGKVPALEDLCSNAGIDSSDEEDLIWNKMMEQGFVPTEEYWIEGGRALAAVSKTQDRFLRK